MEEASVRDAFGRDGWPYHIDLGKENEPIFCIKRKG